MKMHAQFFVEKNGRLDWNRYDLVSFFVIVLSLFIFFFDGIVGRRTLIWDAADYFYPYFQTVSFFLREGQVPLWTPYILNGFPIVANIEAQIFYPLNLFIIPFTTFTPYVVYLSIILHFFVAGISMYLLVRRYLENRHAALLAAMVYMYSGFTVGHFQHVTIIGVMAWLPIVFFFLDKSLVENKPTYAVYAGLFWGISILAGHPQSSHATAFVMISLLVYRATGGYLLTRKASSIIAPCGLTSLCFLVGLMVSAAQLLPTYELVTAASRGSELPFEGAARSGQLSWQNIIGIYVPNYFGALTKPYWGDVDVSQSLFYVGIVPTIAVGLAVVFARKETNVLFFLGMAVMSLLIAMGEYGALFRVLYSLFPGFNYFRGPANTLFIFTFFAAFLTAYGVCALKGEVRPRSLCLYSGLFVLVMVALYYISPDPPFLSVPAATNNMRNGLLSALVFFLIGVVLMVLVSCRTKSVYLLSFLVLLTFLDFYWHFSNSITLGRNASPAFYEQQSRLIADIKQHAGLPLHDEFRAELNKTELKNGLFRIYTKPEGNSGAQAVGFNRPMVHNTFIVAGFEPLVIERHRRLVNDLSKTNQENLFKITNSKYVTNFNNKTGAISVEHNSQYLPRAFVVARAFYHKNDDVILEKLAKIDPAAEVILAGEGRDVLSEPLSRSEWEVNFSRYAGEFIEMQTKSQRDGYLVLSDTYYPGWRAWIDGIETPVIRANYNFRAITLPSGEHTVKFRFQSRYLSHGIVVTCVGLLSVAIVFICQYRRFLF